MQELVKRFNDFNLCVEEAKNHVNSGHDIVDSVKQDIAEAKKALDECFKDLAYRVTRLEGKRRIEVIEHVSIKKNGSLQIAGYENDSIFDADGNQRDNIKHRIVEIPPEEMQMRYEELLALYNTRIIEKTAAEEALKEREEAKRKNVEFLKKMTY